MSDDPNPYEPPKTESVEQETGSHAELDTGNNQMALLLGAIVLLVILGVVASI